MTSLSSGRPVRMADCRGLWRRTLLIDTDGRRDTTADVRWLQGITAFVDLRRPAPGSPSLHDGFAGWLHQHDDVFEWSRFTGVQPAGEHPDAGRMCWEGDVLVETGVHADYVEHWVLEPAPGPCWGLSLAGSGGGQGLLVRVGGHFGWATDTVDGVEISLGRVSGAGWEITDSCHPARHGVELRPRLRASALTVGHSGEAWTVTNSEGEVKV
ncbi:hypothetical protein [Mycolicibacterium mengxianglii]|uniref:hypothetical protein n=1 Tax=Mycolicibacterium mengxianglii TaxID=2736649 RepID=UPI001E5C584A|nr:hypothetical protein [Mycolicibacterium mengxianglii]